MKQQYKTEKRKARVSERILITNPMAASDLYTNGDVMTVIKDTGRSGSRSVVRVAEVKLGIYDHEYEVIVGVNTEAAE